MSVFSHIRTEYGEIFHISRYSVQMPENTGQKNSEYGHFSRSDVFLKKTGRRTIHYNSEKEFSNGTFTELLIDNFSRENLVGNDGKILQRFCEITVRVSNKQTFISKEFSEEITKKSRLRDKKELRDHEPKEP